MSKVKMTWGDQNGHNFGSVAPTELKMTYSCSACQYQNVGVRIMYVGRSEPAISLKK